MLSDFLHVACINWRCLATSVRYRKVRLSALSAENGMLAEGSERAQARVAELESEMEAMKNQVAPTPELVCVSLFFLSVCVSVCLSVCLSVCVSV